MGLRRRGPRLNRAAPTPRRRAPLLAACLAGLALLPGCLGLDDQELQRLEVHQRSSQEFYRAGRLRQALQQADKALELDGDHVGMLLIRGFCLVRMGKALESTSQVDRAVVIFEDLRKGDGSDNYRAWLGAGQAHYTRALQHEVEIGRIERRLAGDFLDEVGREQESAWLEREQRGREEHLTLAERCLRHTLSMDNQSENVWALMELVLVLTTRGGHDDEAVELAKQALAQLAQQNDLSRNNLRRNASLTAAGSLELERRIEENLAKERELRDLVATIEFERGALQAALEQFDLLEEHQLMTAALHHNRADVREMVGMYAAAADDLETFLRLRSSKADYDDVARETFARIDALRARAAAHATAGS